MLVDDLVVCFPDSFLPTQFPHLMHGLHVREYCGSGKWASFGIAGDVCVISFCIDTACLILSQYSI